MKRVWLGLAVVLALGLGLGRDGTAAPKGTLTIGIPTDINTLDPYMGPEVNSLNVAFSAMEPHFWSWNHFARPGRAGREFTPCSPDGPWVPRRTSDAGSARMVSGSAR